MVLFGKFDEGKALLSVTPAVTKVPVNKVSNESKKFLLTIK